MRWNEKGPAGRSGASRRGDMTVSIVEVQWATLPCHRFIKNAYLQLGSSLSYGITLCNRCSTWVNSQRGWVNQSMAVSHFDVRQDVSASAKYLMGE